MGSDADFDVRWGLVPRPYRVARGPGEVPVPWVGTRAGSVAGTGTVVSADTAIDVDGRGVRVDVRRVRGAGDLGLPEGIPDWQTAEASLLEITEDGIRLSSTGEAGLLRGSWVLRRLVRAGHGTLPVATVLDRPEYRWRGLGLDLVRHFFGPDHLLTVMDLMEELSLNVLHLHLSDDQGWRVEVPDLPELVARSSGGAVGGDPGGSLSQEDLALLTREAARRGIALVPEVDVPGHTNAALHALPALNPDGEVPPAYTGTEVGFSTLSTAAPGTARFLGAVVAALRPWADLGLHIGGDESHATAPEEYARLVGMALERVHAAGLRAVAWQEAADLLREGDLVQVWDERLDLSGVARAAGRGVRVITSPASRIYLDMKYDDSTPLGLTWMGTTELRDSLEWDPRETVPGLRAGSVEGVEACLWTETVRTFEDLTTLLLPRLAAAAEVAWAGSGVGEWDSFRRRVVSVGRSWQERGLRWHRSPGVGWG